MGKYITSVSPTKVTPKERGKSQLAAQDEELKSTKPGKFPASLHD